MSMNNGWISLHRKLLDWEWFDDSNTFHVFMYCLLRANHKPNSWRGNNIDIGQFITSREKISQDTKLSIQQVRTCLNKLKSTDEITIKTTNKFTLISITNWIEYQQSNQQTNKQVTSNQPSSNHQVTTNNNDNNINNGNNKNIGQKGFEQFWLLYPKKVKRKGSLEKWKAKQLGNISDVIISDVENRIKNDQRWKDGFIPDPTTYLNGDRWEDEITTRQKNEQSNQFRSKSEQFADNVRNNWSDQ